MCQVYKVVEDWDDCGILFNDMYTARSVSDFLGARTETVKVISISPNDINDHLGCCVGGSAEYAVNDCGLHELRKFIVTMRKVFREVPGSDNEIEVIEGGTKKAKVVYIDVNMFVKGAPNKVEAKEALDEVFNIVKTHYERGETFDDKAVIAEALSKRGLR